MKKASFEFWVFLKYCAMVKKVPIYKLFIEISVIFKA